jgi:hypothetical protein
MFNRENLIYGENSQQFARMGDKFAVLGTGGVRLNRCRKNFY